MEPEIEERCLNVARPSSSSSYQELNRKLYDAIEKSLVKKKNADLIERLYKGTMRDQVKYLATCSPRGITLDWLLSDYVSSMWRGAWAHGRLD